jgi:hypothetical protein
VALAACGGSSSRSADLVRDIQGYGNGLRWRDFPASALRVAPAQRSEFLETREQLDSDLRVADWEMKRLEYDSTRYRAQVEVEYTWLLDSRGIVHTTVTRQWWSRHGDRWIIDREVRVRGDSMPGVAEPARRRPRGPSSGTDRRQPAE